MAETAVASKRLPLLEDKKKSNISQTKYSPVKRLPYLEKRDIGTFEIRKGSMRVNFPDLPKEKIDVKYPLLEPYAYAHIKWDSEARELVYILEEPHLEIYEKKVLNLLEDGIKELLNISYLVSTEGETTIQYLEKNVKALLNEMRIKLERESFLKIMYYIYRDFVGLGRVEPLMNDYFIEDIECNGIGFPIYVVHRKYRNLRTNVLYEDGKELVDFVEKLAQKCGQYVSYATPLLDGALPDGSIDYDEPVIYRENNIIKINKIGEFVDRYYKNKESNRPVNVENIEIPCFNPKTLKIEWKKLDYVYRHKVNEDLYELKLEFGRKIKLTGTHSIFILTEEGVKTIKTEDIKEGDNAVIPIKIPKINQYINEINLAKELSDTKYSHRLVLANVPPNVYIEKREEIKEFLNENYKLPRQAFYEHQKKGILPLKLYNLLDNNILRSCMIRPTSSVGIPTFLKIDENLMRLLGLYISEGWLSASRNTYSMYFCLGTHETNLIKDAKNLVKKCFNLGIYVEPAENNAVKLKVNSFALWIVLKEILKLSQGAKQKRIPEIVFNVNPNLQQEFLKYWSLGDYGSTSSKMLSNDISYLSLFNEDIVPFYERERESTIDSRNIKSHEYYTNSFVRNVTNPYDKMVPIEVFNPLKNTHHRLRNKRVNRERLNKIINETRYRRFKDIDNVKNIKFLKEWTKRGFIQDNKLSGKGKKLLDEINVIRKLIDSDLGFVKIKEINRVPSTKEFVYDLSVGGHENFVGGIGGICCHNSRVNATYTEDISSRGPTFTIRKFTKTPWSPVKLIQLNTISPEIMAFLWLLIEYEQNILIVGGTASGKTTLLNALTFFIPPQARIVSIEDTRELNLEHSNWLPSVAREGVGLTNLVGQKYGEVTLFNLLKESFRQNPDYVIVGEIRGQEAYVLFQGMASGHPSFGTMHADSVDTIIKRLRTPPINLSASLVEILDAVLVMANVKSGKKETRRLREVVEIIAVNEDNTSETNIPFMWNPADDTYEITSDSYIFQKIVKYSGVAYEKLQEEFEKRSLLFRELIRRNITDFHRIQEVINDYYKSPKAVLRAFGII